MTTPTYRIASLDPTGMEGAEGTPMRHNDGAMIIMEGEPGGDETRPVLHVTMTIRPKRGEAWKTSDPVQEAFAQRVVALLNGDGQKTVALTETQAAGLPVKAEVVADLTLEDCRMLARWADYQASALWDGLTLQEILNVYRASWEWDTWQGWAEEEPDAARDGWNSAVAPINQMARHA